jgi:enamine deaminase RidA (YjgF/YER057c/UK114 family)
MAKRIVESPEVFPLKKYAALDPPHGIPINMAVKVTGALMWTKQVPVNAQGESVGHGDALAQTRQILVNLAAMAKAAGATMADVVAITWYTTDIEAFYGSNSSQLRSKHLGQPYPTSVVVEVSKLARPEWMIECLAVVNVPAGGA